jgi:hypothetical protein
LTGCAATPALRRWSGWGLDLLRAGLLSHESGRGRRHS